MYNCLPFKISFPRLVCTMISVCVYLSIRLKFSIYRLFCPCSSRKISLKPYEFFKPSHPDIYHLKLCLNIKYYYRLTICCLTMSKPMIFLITFILQTKFQRINITFFRHTLIFTFYCSYVIRHQIEI